MTVWLVVGLYGVAHVSAKLFYTSSWVSTVTSEWTFAAISLIIPSWVWAQWVMVATLISREETACSTTSVIPCLGSSASVVTSRVSRPIELIAHVDSKGQRKWMIAAPTDVSSCFLLTSPAKLLSYLCTVCEVVKLQSVKVLCIKRTWTMQWAKNANVSD